MSTEYVPMHIREVYPSFGNVFAEDASGTRWLLLWQNSGFGIDALTEGAKILAKPGDRGVAHLEPQSVALCREFAAIQAGVTGVYWKTVELLCCGEDPDGFTYALDCATEDMFLVPMRFAAGLKCRQRFTAKVSRAHAVMSIEDEGRP